MRSHACVVLAATALCSAVAAAPAVAQDTYPAKLIRMIAPFPPGGTTDVLCRVVAQRLTDALGRQVIVENRPGASGSIGHEVAARAAPDGYTLLLTAKAALVVNPYLYKRLGYDPLNDFAPVSLVATAGPVLVVHPAVPAKNVRELIALAQARPGQLDLSFSDMVPAVPQVKSGRLRALAVTTAKRSPTLPEVPTMAEAGVKQPFPQQWWAVAAPKGTPRPIIDRINTAMAQMIDRPEVKERFAELGVFPVHTTPERVLELVRIESPEMARYLKLAGVEPE